MSTQGNGKWNDIHQGWTGPAVRLTLLTTNDLHSSADGCCGPDSEPDRKLGGYDRLLTMIESERVLMLSFTK